MNYKGTNISSTQTPASAMDVSPLLKDVYAKPKKKKSRSKRYGRIARLLEKDK
jgi:hypothetical protein